MLYRPKEGQILPTLVCLSLRTEKSALFLFLFFYFWDFPLFSLVGTALSPELYFENWNLFSSREYFILNHYFNFFVFSMFLQNLERIITAQHNMMSQFLTNHFPFGFILFLPFATFSTHYPTTMKVFQTICTCLFLFVHDIFLSFLYWLIFLPVSQVSFHPSVSLILIHSIVSSYISL